MATLIAVYTSSGCVGRCDAKCYNALELGCDCICGGINHGAGEAKAIDNTREMGDRWVHDYARDKGLKTYRGEVNSDVVDQLPLFNVANLSTRVGGFIG